MSLEEPCWLQHSKPPMGNFSCLGTRGKNCEMNTTFLDALNKHLAFDLRTFAPSATSAWKSSAPSAQWARVYIASVVQLNWRRLPRSFSWLPKNCLLKTWWAIETWKLVAAGSWWKLASTTQMLCLSIKLGKENLLDLGSPLQGTSVNTQLTVL